MRRSFVSSMELIGSIKTYEWGKFGQSSKVAQLASLNDPEFQMKRCTPFAELWMGAHTSGSCILKSTGESLETVIRDTPSLIAGLNDLPFLFKVLSINKPLSIQAHPNKQEAKRLHEEFPKIYKDGNHKPELAIALTPFTALCGFRPFNEIYENLSQSPELVHLLGTELIEAIKTEQETGLKECYTKLMNSSHCSICMAIKQISQRFEREQRRDDIGTLFHRIVSEFPNDIGCLSLFFLNIIKLEPGEAIFLKAHEIHAYIDGDCIECMACSDNVIRAGLTPKFKDVKTLLRLVDYRGAPAQSKLFKPVQHPRLKYSKVFSPSVPDFAVVEINVPAEESSYTIENRGCGSILTVLSGTGTISIHEKDFILAAGSILFLPAEDSENRIKEFPLEITSSDGFFAYQAMYNDF